MKTHPAVVATTLSSALLLLLVPLGCGNAGRTAPAPAPAPSRAGDASAPTSSRPTGDTPEVMSSPFGAFDAARLRERLQGSWRVGSESWHIEGTAVTITSPAGTRSGELVVESPVRLAVVQRKHGGESRELFSFAFEGEQLYLGVGDAGVRISDVRWVCELAMAGVLVFDDGHCSFYAHTIDRLADPVDAPCRIADDPGDSRTVVAVTLPPRFRTGAGETKNLYPLHDAVVDARMMASKAERLPR